MKNLYAVLLLVFFSLTTSAQIVNIPDPIFKNYLLNRTPTIDLNNDGEIQVSEALLVESISYTGHNPNPDIYDLTGIEAFINLTHLHCADNQISSLNLASLTNLQYLNFEKNRISSIDLTGLNNLTKLNCTQNRLTSLEVNHLTNLTEFRCGRNRLTSLDVSNLVNLTLFTCNQNDIASIDLSNLIHLNYFICYSNELETLDISNTQVDYLSCYNNQNLTYANLKNGVTTGLTAEYFQGCNNLIYLCVDDVEFQSFQDVIQNYNLTNVQLNTYCSFVPGGNYNTITGTLTFDNDNNGCDVNDYHLPNLKIKIDDVSAQFGETFTSSTGNYNFFTQTGDFQITPEFENPYFTASPPSATITFADSNNNSQIQLFCITANGVHNDIEVSILPIQRARPGFDATYQLVYKNKGNQTLSGNVNFTFDDAVLDFVSAIPNITSQSLNSLNWNYLNLLPFESRVIDFTLNVNSPMEVPSVNIGNILNFTATIDPVSGDETPTDNTFLLSQTVVGSFDPNDKTCLEGNTITPELVGGYLHYIIRFQNSGTAVAENIVVKDIIDTTKFDIASLQLTSSSHPQVTKVTSNKVEFQFENINLPAEIDDEPGSHGYIAFKIKTKGNLVIGNSVANKADIYFDYNFPIETNTATSTVALLGLNTFENTSVTLAPNPTKGMVQINSKDKITSIQLFDFQGRIIQSATANTLTTDFDLSQQKAGIYFLKIYTVKGVKVEKILKE